MRLVQQRGRFGTRGFTLIELMVVIVLIGIMTAMILPEMKGTYEGALLRSEARKLADVFSLAGSRAITVNQTVCVRLENGRYSIEKRSRENEGRKPHSAAEEFSGSQGALDTRIALQVRQQTEETADDRGQPGSRSPGTKSGESRGGWSVSFYSDGTADDREVRLRDREGFRLALRINPITARVSIVELERE